MTSEMTYPNEPAVGRTDTSAQAAEAISAVSGRLRRLVLGAIRNAGQRGLTTNEAADLLNIGRDSIQPRTSELRALGLIWDSGHRRPNKNGKAAIVWTAGPAR